MNRRGVGPKWVAWSLLFAAPAITVRVAYPEFVRISWLPRPLVIAVGIALLAFGLPFCVSAIVTLARDFEAGRLHWSRLWALLVLRNFLSLKQWLPKQWLPLDVLAPTGG